ncbi:hypothetical protein AB0P36_18175 [Streptomyces flavidovirens]|uniref:hypothetical protein n=1 Tax=Streptomyces flavidovirens TaxID=67298 RepID=UPI0034129984
MGQAVDELRREPLPAVGDTAEDDGQGLEWALADTKRQPTDMAAVRRLVDEMAAACGRLGRIALELAPAFYPPDWFKALWGMLPRPWDH